MKENGNKRMKIDGHEFCGSGIREVMKMKNLEKSN